MHGWLSDAWVARMVDGWLGGEWMDECCSGEKIKKTMKQFHMYGEIE